MFANTQMMGMDLGFPDVCLTPAGPVIVPVPYPNIALGSTAIPNQLIVMIVAMPAHNLGTITPLTNGDQAGVAGDVQRRRTVVFPARPAGPGPARRALRGAGVPGAGLRVSARCKQPRTVPGNRRERVGAVRLAPLLPVYALPRRRTWGTLEG